jgi:hypothetical protein
MGVEEVPAERSGWSAVQCVARHRMADAGEMNADLVGTAGPDADLEQREFLEAL